MRELIVNADDLGHSEGVDRGILEAHEHGIVTSASLLVRFPHAAAAVAHDGLDLGLHVDLGEWAYVGGEWCPLYERVALDDASAVAAEVEHQLAEFRRLTGREPTHLDSHQHVHRNEPVASVARTAGARLGVPVRHFGAVRYCGAFYGQWKRGESHLEAVSVEALISILRSLPEGTTELACHPGYVDGGPGYARERALEVRTLCDPRVRAVIDEEAIELATFAATTRV
jgi:predicted glycoside hydrolase/deacetylase ChbG (UPF0249 family)